MISNNDKEENEVESMKILCPQQIPPFVTEDILNWKSASK